jgi:phage gpG-like protein
VQIRLGIQDEDLTRGLRAYQSRFGDMRPVTARIGQIVRTSAVRNFERGGRPMKWKPSLRVLRKGGKTLVLSHRLMNSITAKAYRDRAEIGTNLPYAAIQQLGGTIKHAARSETFLRKRYVRGEKKGSFKRGTAAGRGFTFGAYETKIPAREYLLVQDEDWTEIRSAVLDYINGRMGT